MRLFHDAAGRGRGGCQPSPRAPWGRVGKALELHPRDGPSVGCQLGESALSPHWARPRDGGLRERGDHLTGDAQGRITGRAHAGPGAAQQEGHPVRLGRTRVALFLL